MLATAQKTQAYALNADEAAFTLNSDHAFYEARTTFAQPLIAESFNPHAQTVSQKPLEALDHWDANHVKTLAENYLDAIFHNGWTMALDEFNTLALTLYRGCLSDIRKGIITLDQKTSSICERHYTQGLSKTAIATQDGVSLYTINKALMDICADTFKRYQAVQQGQGYDIVMGDRQGHIHDQPAFDPIITVHNDEDAKKYISEGALVSRPGALYWHTVSDLTSYNGVVFTKSGIASLPLRVIPAKYREQAHRLACNIDTRPM